MVCLNTGWAPGSSLVSYLICWLKVTQTMAMAWILLLCQSAEDGMQNNMERYCGSSFWDSNITWNTESPDFTECFENTALLWPVLGFLWVGVIIEIYFWSEFDQYLTYSTSHIIYGGIGIPSWRPGWTWLGIFKLSNIALIIILQGILLWEGWSKPDMYWVSPVILISTHLLSGGLIVTHKNRYVHTSGLQLVHWLFLSILQGIMFRTKLRTFHMHELDDNYLTSSSGNFAVVVMFGVMLAVMIFQTFLFCLSDIPKAKDEDHTRLIDDDQDGVKLEECPILRASSLSYILFSWATNLVLQGNKSTLTKTDLWELLPSLRSRYISCLFNINYEHPMIGENQSIFRNIIKPLIQTCGWSYAMAATFRLSSALLSFLPPTLMGYLIDFVQDSSIEGWKGYFWAVALFLIFILMTVLLEQFMYHMFICYANVGTCLHTKLYSKSLQISNNARKDKTTGEIVNLMSIDSQKIRQLVYEVDSIWATPIQIIIGMTLIWHQLGVAVLPGIGVLCTMIPINWALSAVASKYQTSMMTLKDRRIKTISEVLNGIHVIKLYAWEPPFQSQIEKVRSEEIKFLGKRFIITSVLELVTESIPLLVSIAAFFTYIFMSGGELDPKKAFTSVSLFTLLTEPITNLPFCISACVDAVVSFKRINSFLNAEEIDPMATRVWEDPHEENDNDGEGGGTPFPAIQITQGTFAWEDLPTSNFQLNQINLEVKPGELTAIVGTVASGKSSLLSAILGDMTNYDGEVRVRGKIAYAPQLPWILNDTLRENICFGSPYIKEKFDKVVEACCLVPDIGILPAGDLTEIGEKGINLSGGQKQRVSLARVAYSGADVLIMDDVLSAVDSHVGKHIWDRLIGNGGLLRGKTRLLCTHAYNFLSQVDNIVVMEEGRILATGPYSELTLGGSGTFSQLLSRQDQTSQRRSVTSESEGEERPLIKKKSVGPGPEEDGKIIEEERMEIGDVKRSIFLGYIRAMSYPLVTGIIVLFASSEGLSLGRNLVLSKWTSQANHVNGSRGGDQGWHSTQTFAIWYAILGIVQSIVFFLAFIALAFACLRSTKLLHNNMLRRILLAPMSFFNTTPLGRIVNRFSSDVDTIDISLRSYIATWLLHIFKFFGILVAISYANAYFIIFIIPLSILYYFLQRYYVTCSQQLQRFISAGRSPIYAQFQETLQGTSTIRAYQDQERFCRILSGKIDTLLENYFPDMILRRWLGIRLGLMGAFVVFIPAMFAVVWRDSADPSLVGLSISYSLEMVNYLNYLVKATSYVQCSFVAVERVMEYSEVEQEAEFQTKPEQSLSPSWPQEGSITFKEYQTRYRPCLDLVLKNVSCHISPGEKIGIVGRTGAGKSSLTLALFRIIEGVQGEIQIDEVNIALVGLHDLRRRMTVIPQDPVLLSSSLRLNLDPFGEHEDDRLWEALRLAHLSQFVMDLDEGLEYQIAEGGENLSVGQRQLVCLARAVLRRSNILILDEATASVDTATDELIQQTLREHFSGCTILNVAHRLKTVLDSSRILVLSAGAIVEFDSPQALLADPNSHFYAMAKDAGIIQ